jgi:hypothetical protein
LPPPAVGISMTNDIVIARITIAAPAATVFGVLADPSTHAAIDGTGWVRESLDGVPLTQHLAELSGQVGVNNPD